jgi:HEAT repeat protein
MWLGAGRPVHGTTTDPVEELRRALPMRPDDVAQPTAAVVTHRAGLLRKQIERLKTVSELRRALLLPEWRAQSEEARRREAPGRVGDLQKLDNLLRKEIADRLKAALVVAAASPEPNARLAVANVIAELGPAVRINPGDVHGYARELTDIVIKLAADTDLGVRQEALRALSNINPDPGRAAEVFREVLQKDSPGPRRLAADGLAQLVRVAHHLFKLAKAEPENYGDWRQQLPELRTTTRAVILVAPEGLGDGDSQVRSLALEAVQVAALTLADLVESPLPSDFFPPEGRKLSKDEVDIVNMQNEVVKTEIEELEPNLKALRSQVEGVAKALKDAEPRVRLLALNTLESIGQLRQRLRKRATSVPLYIGPGTSAAESLKVDPLEALVRDQLGDVIRLLADSDVRIRRTAVDLLDVLDEAAAPGIPALANMLSDPDRFVRWAAVRALGHIAPAKTAGAVPRIAALVADPDLNVSLGAVTTLEALGPLASPAIPALIKGIQHGEVDVQVAAIAALRRIGLEHAKGAIPALVDALKPQVDVRVRRAAADLLGRFGGDARAAVPALRDRLGDEDSEVRTRASEALLNILLGN